jgi:putative polyhydroxyalkanoate system protein
MPKFTVDIPHQLSPQDAKARLEKARGKLEADYGVTCRWDGETRMLVNRKGLDGRVDVHPDRLAVDVDLGLLLMPAMGAIRKGITEKLTKLVNEPA